MNDVVAPKPKAWLKWLPLILKIGKPLLKFGVAAGVGAVASALPWLAPYAEEIRKALLAMLDLVSAVSP